MSLTLGTGPLAGKPSGDFNFNWNGAPAHRVYVFEASRPARVRVNGVVVAETDRAKLLYETGLPVRVYVPGADIAPGTLTPSETRTVCPYKGEATYWHVHVDGAR